MSVIDRAKNHFAAKDVRVIEVEEWGDNGQPLKVYSKPMTLAEKRKLFNGAKDADIGILVDVLIMKARDEKGDALFTLENKRDLLNAVDPEIIGRVASLILADQSVEELAKN